MQEGFSAQELARYSRHLNLPDFDEAHQKKLKDSSVLIVGVGGLGAPVSLYLTAAGIGTIGIVDFDIVEESNLQRQVLFDTDDLGQLKVEVAERKLKKLNPYVNIKIYPKRLEASNALQILQDYDVVADGTDNFATRYLVNDACVLLGIPNVYASIFRFEGQASVFNFKDDNDHLGPNYRDLFPSPPPPGLVPSCAEGGVLGVLPGILGSIQANEVLKIITGIGTPLSGRLMLMDTFDFNIRFLNVKKRDDNPISGKNPTQTGLINYNEFCGMNIISNVPTMTVTQLDQMVKSGDAFTLIDVREPYEKNIADIGGIMIPKGEIENRLSEIPKQGVTIFYCRSGKRSKSVVKKLINQHHYKNVFNLEGGILAWKEQIDDSLTKY